MHKSWVRYLLLAIVTIWWTACSNGTVSLRHELDDQTIDTLDKETDDEKTDTGTGDGTTSSESTDHNDTTQVDTSHGDDTTPVDTNHGDDTTPADTGPINSDSAGWLHTEGNRIYDEQGNIWHGRGMNIHDTRSCWSCSAAEPNPDEVKRRIDEAVDVWGADFLRLCLENYVQDTWMVQWQNVLDDPDYLADIKEIVDHVGSKPGVYLMVTLWVDASFSSSGWPTEQTIKIWEKLAETFAGDSHVIFGLVNEPEMNYDGSLDAQVWTAMNDAVAAIRVVEDSLGANHHLISVQGTGGWARLLSYYVTHPIAAGNGENVIYETHVYDPQSSFASRFENPSETIPVVIGEFGPVTGVAEMSMNDCTTLMESAEELQIPYLAWTFHPNCPPNLIQSTGSGCGVGMNLVPTAWGQLLKDQLLK